MYQRIALTPNISLKAVSVLGPRTRVELPTSRAAPTPTTRSFTAVNRAPIQACRCRVLFSQEGCGGIASLAVLTET